MAAAAATTSGRRIGGGEVIQAELNLGVTVTTKRDGGEQCGGGGWDAV